MSEAEIENSVIECLKRPYSFVLTPEAEGGYSASVLEFPGCLSDGDTPNEAIANIMEAAKGWLAVSIEHGHKIPEPLDLSQYQRSSFVDVSLLNQATKHLIEIMTKLQVMSPDQVVLMARPSARQAASRM